jgi:hypothetical protein
MTADAPQRKPTGRGCVYFNFGSVCTLKLVVSIHSLRKHYDGPITVFLAPDKYSDALKLDIEKLGGSVTLLENLTASFDRHRIFLNSPYETTLSLDSDIIFLGPIDPLWEPLEQEGVLVTRFFAPPYGVDGTANAHCDPSRVELLKNVEGIVDPAAFERALSRMCDNRIDINIGVFGISRPRGDKFLNDWAQRMEMGRGKSILLLDEMLVVAMINDYPHFLAGEIWNCPADEFFRRTNLADARVIHYFADGHRLLGDQRMGRNPRTWAGKKWYEAYFETASVLDLSRWRVLDIKFDNRVEAPFTHGPIFAIRNFLREIERGVRHFRDFLLNRSYWRRFR